MNLRFSKLVNALKAQLWRVYKFFGGGLPEVKGRFLRANDEFAKIFDDWGMRHVGVRPRRIVLYGGMGYGNVGDEAQMGASIGRWQNLIEDVQLTVFSPHPEYSEAQFGVKAEWAPRVAWFHSNTKSIYFGGGFSFAVWWAWLWFRLTLTARSMRSGVPFLFCSTAEYEVLRTLQRSDALHVSGGGYLTGKTRSRLWECGLVMRLCQLLGTPYLLTGQTIGVFRNPVDRWVAKRALSGASLIYLRDHGISENDLKTVGIEGDHIKSSFDDALFFESLDDSETKALLKTAGIDPVQPYVVANFHYWGQLGETIDETTARFAELTDRIAKKGYQILFIPMTPGDEPAEDAVVEKMEQTGLRLHYNYDYRIARAVYKFASAVFTMKHHPIIFAYGEGVPVLSVALDDYYYHKNKGAMDHCGHGRLCIDQSIFYQDEAEAIIDGFFNDLLDLKAEVCAWKQKVKCSETEPHRRFCEMLGLNAKGDLSS